MCATSTAHSLELAGEERRGRGQRVCLSIELSAALLPQLPGTTPGNVAKECPCASPRFVPS